jgi:hypothetical protein
MAIATGRIAELAMRLELNPEAMSILYNQWLFTPLVTLNLCWIRV